MQWNKGYSASFYLATIDPATWRPSGRIEVISGQIARSRDALMQSADITCRNYPQALERWVRVYMDVRQETGASAHVPLFTGLATSPKTDYGGNLRANSVTCYSVLKPAADILLPRGWYALAGQDGGRLVSDLLGVGPAPVEVEQSAPALSSTIVAEDGETNLSMAQKILTAMGWRLRIDGNGSILVCPPASEPSATFGTGFDVIEPVLTSTVDLFACPNVFRAIIGGQSAVSTDNNPDSSLSVSNRGRQVWAEEISPVLAGGESLQSYADRRLAELQTVADVVQYSRRYHPDAMPGDLVRLEYPGVGLLGDYAVVSQTVTLGYNAQTAETVAKVR